jgi:hypothetical protein
MGLMVGRRIGVKILDSYFAVDLSKLFTAEGALFLI